MPSNSSSRWTKADKKKLKEMVKDGAAIKEIADVLERTPAAIIYQKSTMGITVKKGKGVKIKSVKVPSMDKSMIKPNDDCANVSEPQVSMRDNAKEMTKVARQIARVNGKRITMAMFFVEDL